MTRRGYGRGLSPAASAALWSEVTFRRADVFRFDPGWKTIESFRALYDTIVALQPDAVPEYLLGPGIEYAGPLMRPIQPYKHRHFPGHSYDLPGGGRWDDLWDLYAVSRISDHLLLAFQSFDLSSAGPHVARWLGELLPPSHYPCPSLATLMRTSSCAFWSLHHSYDLPQKSCAAASQS